MTKKRTLSPVEILESDIFILENHLSQMKLHDARSHVAAINLILRFRESSMTFDDSTKFINDTSSPECSEQVSSFVAKFSRLPKTVLMSIRESARCIIEDLS